MRRKYYTAQLSLAGTNAIKVLFPVGTSSSYEDQTDFTFPEVFICIWTKMDFPLEYAQNMTHRFQQYQKENFIIYFHHLMGQETNT